MQPDESAECRQTLSNPQNGEEPRAERRRRLDRERKRAARQRDRERRFRRNRLNALASGFGASGFVGRVTLASALILLVAGTTAGWIGRPAISQHALVPASGQTGAGNGTFLVPVLEDPESRRELKQATSEIRSDLQALRTEGSETRALLADISSMVRKSAAAGNGGGTAGAGKTRPGEAGRSPSGKGNGQAEESGPGKSPLLLTNASPPNAVHRGQSIAETGDSPSLPALTPVPPAIDLSTPVVTIRQEESYPFFPGIEGPRIGKGKEAGKEQDEAEKSAGRTAPDSATGHASVLDRQIEPLKIFDIRAGETLRDTLQRWTETSGWKLVYSTPRSFPIAASASFEARLIDAETPDAGALSLLFSSHRDPHLPVPQVYLRNRTIVVSDTRQDN